MKLFLVERTSFINYDEYDSCVIIAESKEELVKKLNEKDKNDIKDLQSLNPEILFTQDYSDNGDDDRKITEIKLEEINETCILCSSYNAG